MKQKQLTAQSAALSLAQGKPGTLGFLVAPNGRTEFMGYGFNAPVRMLRLSVNGNLFTETTNTFNLIMRRGKLDRPAWAALADADWNELMVSDNTNATVSCVALVEPPASQFGQASDDTKLPIAVKAYFGPTRGYVVVLYEDYDFCNMVAAECEAMSMDTERKERDNDERERTVLFDAQNEVYRDVK